MRASVLHDRRLIVHSRLYHDRPTVRALVLRSIIACAGSIRWRRMQWPPPRTQEPEAEAVST